MISLEQFYDLLNEQSDELQIGITPEGELAIFGPDEMLQNGELIDSIVENAEKVISMGLQLGLHMPTEVISEFQKLIMDIEEEQDNGKQ